MAEEKSLNFIEEIIDTHLKDGVYPSIVTRFPPEPNGYLHIGHASSICLNFGLTKRFPGYTNLRFDDTNPVTEDTEYVESIKEDLRWLGFEWKYERYASDYFEQLYALALTLIKKGLAYVDDLTAEEIADQKGTPTEPGVNSPYRTRSIEENRDLFVRMKNGEFSDGAKTLRAKIEMGHNNMLMRDPILYRIRHAHHHRTGDAWCIYPMYDFAHGQSDAIEQITHSICTMEFTPHRELYDWLIAQLEIYPSHQYEFARRNINYTVTSKRKLLQLVVEKKVAGWDDPRMPTLSGLRRRGYTPESIREFCERIGVAKRDNLVDVGLLEFCVREHLNRIALRRMVVFDPVKIVLTNYDGEEWLSSENNPEDPTAGHRQIPFSRELYIEREDFMENPPKKYFRLSPGQLVRLKSAYIIRCEEVIKDPQGLITEIRCAYIAESKSGSDTSGISVKGTLHWVSVSHAVKAEVRMYDRLFNVEDPTDESQDFLHYLNPSSLTVLPQVMAEPSLLETKSGDRYQFVRKGYFVLDKDSQPTHLVFNKTVGLKDGWNPAKG
ncbi:MAG: glutamine--tRNA ligase/YqeY domain fusion protein [Bacteroidetes bacterium]|nr:glutamine--tRNA ligase/YqeY domain fusion protein [Bacteroidota bacterium]